ncbi:aldehyde dehydrogenase [Arenicella chitinivorans]|uniref:Aldehyde dehydrogenase n=2 Tax=Arenicella chitinivorans TaxID=1329800 RepID=A0A918S4W4_9GAMM|nr:aldehyde dehydrogenase [Arenicella chitinivorans]
MDMNKALQRQKQANLKAAYAPASVREDRLDRLIDLITRFEEPICEALMSDYGYRSIDQIRFAEVVTTLKPLKTAKRKLQRWMRPERRTTGLPFNLAGGRSEVIYQPLGSVGIISPWNFPINLTFSPLAGVIAAGNRAMIKPSELTPATSSLMDQMIKESFDPEEITVVTGGPETGKAFSQLPFDHLIYTGGEAVAKHIMRAAAENLVPLTLELGGKSPVVISDSAKLPLAAKRILFGKLFNAGQICLAPDTVFVPEKRLEEFIKQMKLAAHEIFPQEKKHHDYVAVINANHAGRINGYLANAVNNGADVISLGPTDCNQAELEQGLNNIVPITLVVNPNEEADINKDEIFGPLLLVKTYSDFDHVIDHINLNPKPLALYYFGRNKNEQQRLLLETSSGGMTINDVIMHYTIDDLPFGGVGASGMGAYHGFDGFKQFSHARSVYRQSPFDVGAMLRPPYEAKFKVMNKLLRLIS